MSGPVALVSRFIKVCFHHSHDLTFMDITNWEIGFCRVWFTGALFCKNEGKKRDEK